MSGRFHLYEGYNQWEVTYGIRTMQQLGINTLLISNAAAEPSIYLTKKEI